MSRDRAVASRRRAEREGDRAASPTSIPDGPAPYFTILAPARRGSEVEQWDEIKAAVSEALIDAGGTITHHHAVGRDHRPWYDRQRPDQFAAALRAAKRARRSGGDPQPGRADQSLTQARCRGAERQTSTQRRARLTFPGHAAADQGAAPAGVDQEPAGLRRPAVQRAPRRERRRARCGAHVRRLLRDRERRLSAQRPPRPRARPSPSREARPADRQRRTRPWHRDRRCSGPRDGCARDRVRGGRRDRRAGRALRRDHHRLFAWRSSGW